MWPAHAFGARAFAATDRGRAERLASELLAEWEEQDLAVNGESAWLSDISAALVALGTDGELATLVARSQVKTPWRKAAAAYVAGDFQGAADEYSAIGALPEEADARLLAAEALVREGRRAEADAELKRSLAFWRSVGADAYVRQGEALLAAAG
jgi:hypothetical protein